MFELVAFDADDTLWDNESIYTRAKKEFEAALAPFHPRDQIGPTLDEVEVNNLVYYGYGIKSFTLSMIETALTLMGERPSVAVFDRIFTISREILASEVELLPEVEATLASLVGENNLMLLTKGDHFEQQSKIDRSNLVDYFQAVEIVGDKTPAAYRAILNKYQLKPEHFLMIGNSLRSDILPVLKIGGEAIYVPFPNTWDHENVPTDDLDGFRYHQVESIVEIPDLLLKLKQHD
jgi:putative hydrolase of the HAD superfamily